MSNEKLNKILEDAHRIQRRYDKATLVSKFTPCQITGKPGISLKGGAGYVPMHLSPEMWDTFDQRIRDTTEFNEANSAVKAYREFLSKNSFESLVGNLKKCEDFLYACSATETSSLKAGFAAINILRAMKDEYENTEVSS